MKLKIPADRIWAILLVPAGPGGDVRATAVALQGKLDDKGWIRSVEGTLEETAFTVEGPADSILDELVLHLNGEQKPEKGAMQPEIRQTKGSSQGRQVVRVEKEKPSMDPPRMVKPSPVPVVADPHPVLSASGGNEDDDLF